MIVTADLFRRAGAACIAAEPHRTPEQDWPCPACLHRLAVASASPREVARPSLGMPTELLAVPQSVSGSTSAMNNRPVREHRAVEGATELARKEGNR